MYHNWRKWSVSPHHQRTTQRLVGWWASSWGRDAKWISCWLNGKISPLKKPSGWTSMIFLNQFPAFSLDDKAVLQKGSIDSSSPSSDLESMNHGPKPLRVYYRKNVKGKGSMIPKWRFQTCQAGNGQNRWLSSLSDSRIVPGERERIFIVL